MSCQRLHWYVVLKKKYILHHCTETIIALRGTLTCCSKVFMLHLSCVFTGESFTFTLLYYQCCILSSMCFVQKLSVMGFGMQKNIALLAVFNLHNCCALCKKKKNKTKRYWLNLDVRQSQYCMYMGRLWQEESNVSGGVNSLLSNHRLAAGGWPTFYCLTAAGKS